MSDKDIDLFDNDDKNDFDIKKNEYQYATHPELVKYEQQENLGGLIEPIAENPDKAIENKNINYIKLLYPYATHPELMTYEKQENLDGLVEPIEMSPKEEQVEIPDIEKTPIPKEYDKKIKVGEIIVGTGGDAPLENSVLYNGSDVSRKSNGLDTVVINKAEKDLPDNNNIPPYATQSPPPYASVKQEADSSQTDVMNYDVLIVGAGPSGLSTAIQIKKQAIQEQRDVRVCVVEKGAEVGAHILSGAVLEPRALNELIPDWQEKSAPLNTPAKNDKFFVLTKNKSFRLPTPPQMHNKGNYIISLGKFAKWLSKVAEEMGVEIYTSTSASGIIKEDGRVVGIRTGAFGVDKDGNNTSQYVEGMELRAKYTVMGEGVRGHLTKELFEDYDLRNNCDPQTFGIGIKELWEIPAQNSKPGEIIHTSGWPLDSKTYGGSFLYHLQDNLVSVGFVVGLDYKNPHLFPYMEFQRFKHHPKISKHLKGGRRISYGARAINEGGFQSIPKLTFKGGLIVGCSAGFVNVPKIKGTHTAMKSGMIAGQELYKAIISGNIPDELVSYPEELKKSWLWSELKSVRNIRPSFHKFGYYGGLAYSGFTTLLGGREPWTFKNNYDHLGMVHKNKAKKIKYPQPDGVLSFDRLTNVAFSGTVHEANQPIHLKLKDKEIPISVSLEKYDMPETRFCPAGVYELIENNGKSTLQINAQNCVHCKTCDIKDPCQNINWVAPEGGNGPNYQGM